MPAKKRSAAPYAVLKEIAAGEFRSLYILFGGDAVLAEEIVTALREKLVAPGLEPFDLEMVHATDIGGDRLQVEEIWQHALQPPMGSTRRLMVIRDLDVLDIRVARTLLKGVEHDVKPEGGGRKVKKSYGGLRNLPESSCVAVTCDYDPDWPRVFTAAGVNDAVVSVKPPDGPELVELVRRWAAERKLVMAAPAVQALVAIAGEETGLLKSEVEKLATVLEPGTKVTVEEVRRLASSTREYGLAEYIAALREWKAAEALAVLRRLWDDGVQPVQVVFWLTRMLLERKRAGRGLDALNRAIERLYDIDKAYLSGHPEPEALLDVYSVCLCCFGQRNPCALAEADRKPGFCLGPGEKEPARRTA